MKIAEFCVNYPDTSYCHHQHCLSPRQSSPLTRRQEKKNFSQFIVEFYQTFNINHVSI